MAGGSPTSNDRRTALARPAPARSRSRASRPERAPAPRRAPPSSPSKSETADAGTHRLVARSALPAAIRKACQRCRPKTVSPWRYSSSATSRRSAASPGRSSPLISSELSSTSARRQSRNRRVSVTCTPHLTAQQTARVEQAVQIVVVAPAQQPARLELPVRRHPQPQPGHLLPGGLDGDTEAGVGEHGVPEREVPAGEPGLVAGDLDRHQAALPPDPMRPPLARHHSVTVRAADADRPARLIGRQSRRRATRAEPAARPG